MKSNQTLDISVLSILKVLMVLILIWFVFVVRDIIAIMFVAIIIASAMSPVIDKAAARGIPRGLTIGAFYIFVIGLLGAVVYFIIPPMVGQLKQLAAQLPTYFDYFSNAINHLSTISSGNLTDSSQQNINTISKFLNDLSTNIFDTTKGFIGGFTAVVTVFVLTLYLLLDEDGIKKFFVALLPIKQKAQIQTIAHKVGMGLGSWFRGQLLLGLVIGVLVYVGLLLLNVPYALTLGILAGILELIPVIGPIISAIPAILIALSISPTSALMVAVFYILIQELENKLLVPKVMQKTVGLHPVTIIIVLLIGAKLMGLMGILLAVPVTTMIYIILKEWTTLSRPSRSK
jgi:predicted PurR-regulated permease PerM